jgi:hypothetical protein
MVAKKLLFGRGEFSLERVRTRRRKPIASSTLENWEATLRDWTEYAVVLGASHAAFRSPIEAA